jgi:hypothetical protein
MSAIYTLRNTVTGATRSVPDNLLDFSKTHTSVEVARKMGLSDSSNWVAF